MLPKRDEHGNCYSSNDCNKCTQKMWCDLYPHELGTNYYVLGIGYRIYTMRDWVTLDTLAELQEELNDIESFNLPPSGCQ